MSLCHTNQTKTYHYCRICFLLETHNLLKDASLISALFVSIAGCIYAFFRQRQTQENLNLMSKELEILQQAEGSLLAVTER